MDNKINKEIIKRVLEHDKGPGITVPFADHKLLLGTWQQIVLLDFDTRARRREIVVQIMGE